MTDGASAGVTAAGDSRRVMSLIGILGGSAILHFVVPKPYQKIVPPQFGDARTLVYASGIAELICAGMLAAPRSRRLGGLASAALFVAVFPANIYAVKVMGGTRLGRAAAIARMPLQWPLITSALRVAREA